MKLFDFLEKRPGHTRCVVCHSERSNNAFRLEKLSPGSKAWSEEQSRRNFEMASRLVVPGNPQAGLLLSIGREQFLTAVTGSDACHRAAWGQIRTLPVGAILAQPEFSTAAADLPRP